MKKLIHFLDYNIIGNFFEMAIIGKKLYLEIPSFPKPKIQLPPFVRFGNPYDKYKIIEQIGKGAFGSVIKVKEDDITFRAIKNVDVSKSSCLIKKALKEATIGIDIIHPNIVKTHEVFYDGYNFFFVMDFVSPISFSSLALKDKLLLFQQLVLADEHLISNGFLHRDIKLENTGLIVDKNGKLQLLLFDFGEACRISDECDKCAGTVLNMSPEVVKYCEYSESSEVWSLMCYLIEIITGKSMIWELFTGEHGSIQSIHIQLKIDSLKEPPIPEVFKKDTSSPSGLIILEILERGLAIDPKKRLTILELKHLLQQLIDSL
jgi:serine/threonine protein kinase